MIHFKPHINQTEHGALLDKFITVLDDQKIIIGGQAIYKPLHYHDKNFNEKIYNAKLSKKAKGIRKRISVDVCTRTRTKPMYQYSDT